MFMTHFPCWLLLLSACLLASVAEAQVKPLPEGRALPDYARVVNLTRTGVQTGLNEMSGNGLPNIMLTGYWPPTNEMIRSFSPDLIQNPQGWIGADWEGRGYNIYAFFPEFPGGVGKGEGDFEVDYQDSSADFWLIADQLKPVAILTFGLAYPNEDWQVDWRHRNLVEMQWFNDYLAPTLPTPAPPDGSVAAGFIRYAALPLKAIIDAVNSSPIHVNAFVNKTGNSGGFLCEFIGYHASWYHDLHCELTDPDPCIACGHIHVGSEIDLSDAVEAVEITVRTLIESLDNPLVPTTRILRQAHRSSVSFSLDGGVGNGNRNYFLLASLSGTSPGLLLPPGWVTLPLNWDSLTQLTISHANSPAMVNFKAVLDAEGRSTAQLNTLGLVNPSAIGLTLNFAYLLYDPVIFFPYDYVSNPVEIEVVP